MVSDPTPTPPLQGRIVPTESKTYPQPLPSGRGVPADKCATDKAAAAPLPSRGGAGVGSLFSHTNLFLYNHQAKNVCLTLKNPPKATK